MLGSACVRVRIRAKRVSTTVRLSVCVRVRVIDYREAGNACACVDKNFNSHLGAFVNG